MHATSTEPAFPEQPSILPILSVNFVGTLGFSIVVPFMVFLVAKWGGNAIIYGVAASTYSVFQLIGAPILGNLSDRLGRRVVLLMSQLGTLLSWVIFLIAFAVPTSALLEVNSILLGQFTVTLPLILLFIARSVDGLTGGNVSVANAYLADITNDDNRSENFGRMAISTNLGFIIGPALAGLLGATVLGEIVPVFAALLISIAASLMIAFGLKDNRPQVLDTKPGMPNACKVFGQETKECYALRGTGKMTMTNILRLPRMAALLAVNFLVMLSFSFFYIAFPTHAALGLNWSVVDTGIFFAVLSLCMALVQGPLLARLSKVLEVKFFVVGGSLILGIGFALMLWPYLVSIYIGASLIALGNGLMWPTFMALLAKQAGKQFQGAVQGFASSSGAAASIIGLIAGGLLYTWVGPWVFVVSTVTISVVSIITAIACPHDQIDEVKNLA
ncbi:MAG: MFS transporter [Pseudomonadota bacterium]